MNENELDLPADMFVSGENPEDTVIVMHRETIGPVNVDVKFTDIDGYAIYEGDIVLSETQKARLASQPGSRGVGIIGEEFRWPEGKIAYFIQEDSLESRVRQAIDHWETRTPFRFTKLQAEPANYDPNALMDYISFEPANVCNSSVGRQGGNQIIRLGPGCGVGSAIHEIGHALGLWHEQSRSDRDQHIQIVWDNIIEKNMHNFNMHVLDGQDLGEYDYGSIMHYPAYAFAIDPSKPTIKTKEGQEIGQRIGLSKGDIAAIRILYPDLHWPTENE